MRLVKLKFESLDELFLFWCKRFWTWSYSCYFQGGKKKVKNKCSWLLLQWLPILQRARLNFSSLSSASFCGFLLVAENLENIFSSVIYLSLLLTSHSAARVSLRDGQRLMISSCYWFVPYKFSLCGTLTEFVDNWVRELSPLFFFGFIMDTQINKPQDKSHQELQW